MTSEMLLIGLNAFTDIPKTMDCVAVVMANYLRDMSNLTVQGQSGFMELYIRIPSWWVLLPTLIVIFGTLLLISVIVITRKHKKPVWKTSELPLFFHVRDLSLLGGGGGGGGGDSISVETLKTSEMENIASTLQAKFERDSEREGGGGVLKLERKSNREQEEN